MYIPHSHWYIIWLGGYEFDFELMKFNQTCCLLLTKPLERDLGRHSLSFGGWMVQLLGRDEKTGYSRTVWPQKDGRDKTGGPAPIGARKAMFSYRKCFHGKSRKNWPAVPPLNKDIIPWRLLGHTVLVFQAGSHFQVQSRIPVLDTVVNPVVRRV